MKKMVESIATVPNIFVPQSSSDIPTCSNTLPRSKRKEEYNTELSINSYFTSRSRKNTSSVLLIALIYSFMFYVIMGYPLEQSRPDLICNDGTPYECVCNRSMGNLDNLYQPCEDFIDVRFYTGVEPYNPIGGGLCPWRVDDFCDVFRLLRWVDEIFFKILSKLPWSPL
jgi:hypothetical protein